MQQYKIITLQGLATVALGAFFLYGFGDSSILLQTIGAVNIFLGGLLLGVGAVSRSPY